MLLLVMLRARCHDVWQSGTGLWLAVWVSKALSLVGVGRRESEAYFIVGVGM